MCFLVNDHCAGNNRNSFLKLHSARILPIAAAMCLALPAGGAAASQLLPIGDGTSWLIVAAGEAGDYTGAVVDIPSDFGASDAYAAVAGATVYEIAAGENGFSTYVARNGAFSNTLTFAGKATQVVGAHAAAASGNTLVLTGSAELIPFVGGNVGGTAQTVEAYALGGWAEPGAASANPVDEAYTHASWNIVAVGVDAVERGEDGASFTYEAGEGGAYVEGAVIGGYNAGPTQAGASAVNAVGNSVLVYKSTVTGSIFGGVARVNDETLQSDASGNQVHLIDAEVGGTVYGGAELEFAADGLNNPWSLNPVIRAYAAENVIRASGVNHVGGLGAGSYNALVLEVGEANRDQAVITSATDLDLSGVAITVEGGSMLDACTLLAVEKAEREAGTITADGNTTITFEGGIVSQTWRFKDGSVFADSLAIEAGTLADAEGDLSADAVSVEKTVNPTAGKLLSEAAAGTAALVADNASFMAGEGISAAKDAAKSGSAAFAAVYGGSSRYITGSHVTLNSGSIAAGHAVLLSEGSSSATLATYAEAGWGSSDSKVEGLRADGDHAFYGVGVAAAWEHESGLHAEAILRGGRAETKNRADFETDSADYKTEAYYFGASIGAGYVWTAFEGVSIDPFVRYSWTRIGSDSASLGNRDNDAIELDAINVGTLRTGVMVEAELSREVTTRLGAAYERVLAGDASGCISGVSLDAPSLEGNRGVFELGLTVRPIDSNIALDLGLSGYCGVREGAAGSATLKYRF